jgi:hypothetical protein
MSGRATPARVPVRLDFGPDDGRAESWGSLESLTPAGARLSTLARLSRGQPVLLTFELGGETFTELRARVTHAAVDPDGFCEAELDFADILARRKLAALLLDVLSR